MKLFASLTLLAAIVVAVPAEAATYHSVEWYNAQTNIASRWENSRASVEARVRDNHTNDDDGTFHEDAYNENMSHIGHLVRCIRDTKTCTAQ